MLHSIIESFLFLRFCYWKTILHLFQGNLGAGTRIYEGAKFSPNKNAPILIGEKCCFERYAVLSTSDSGNIKIGKGVYIGEYTVILSKSQIEIGDNTLIAPHVVIVDFDHVFSKPGVPIIEQGVEAKKVTIGRDVWMGAGCKVLKGITIGEGCVVGAGSVVTKDLPSYSVCIGAPARMIKMRN